MRRDDETEPAEGSGRRIPHVLFDSSVLAPKEAIAQWRDDIGVMFDSRLSGSPEENFYARLDSFMLSEIMLCAANVCAQGYERSRWRAGRDGLDHYLLQFYTEGSVARRGGASDDCTTPGDLWITDLAQPVSSVASSCAALNLIVPRRLLSPLLANPDIHSMRIVSGREPLVALFLNHLQSLYAQAPNMRIEEAANVVTPTLQLAAAAINGAAHRKEETQQGLDEALRSAIGRYVMARLGEDALTTERVAQEFGVSRRKIAYLFEPLGGFAAWVRRKRLQSARMALVDPARMHCSIEEIAAAHGFRYQANFTAAFRAAFCMTPGQLRALARERIETAGGSRTSTSGNSWRDWIADL